MKLYGVAPIKNGIQTDFLNDIFGEILWYTYKRGEAETNLEKEEKTELDGQKADGILGFFNSESPWVGRRVVSHFE